MSHDSRGFVKASGATAYGVLAPDDSDDDAGGDGATEPELPGEGGEDAAGPIVLGTGQILTEFNLEGFGLLVREKSSAFYAFMVLGGVCSPSLSPACVWIYTTVWVCAFVVCGTLCAYNCRVREPPFHFAIVDFTVALVHLPGLLSVLFWRRAFRVKDSPLWSVIRAVHKSEPHWEALCGNAHVLGLLMIPCMLLTTGLVYVGFAYPAHLAGADNHHSFSWLHAWSMWLVIPPVVCNVLATAAFFGFMLRAHCMDIYAGSGKLTKLAEKMRPDAQGSIRTSGHGDFGGILKRRIQILRHSGQPPTGNHHDLAITKILHVVDGVQTRLDKTADMLGAFLTIHMIVAIFALLAASIDVYFNFDYFTVSTVCVDLFLIIKALLEVCGFVLMGAYTTNEMDVLIIGSINSMLDCGVPCSIALPMYSYLRTLGRCDGSGFKLIGVPIDTTVVATFVSGMISAFGMMVGAAAATDRF